MGASLTKPDILNAVFVLCVSAAGKFRLPGSRATLALLIPDNAPAEVTARLVFYLEFCGT